MTNAAATRKYRSLLSAASDAPQRLQWEYEIYLDCHGVQGAKTFSEWVAS